jgi:hypothetical protein
MRTAAIAAVFLCPAVSGCTMVGQPVTAPAVFSPGPRMAAMPAPPPGRCYDVDRRGMLRYDRAGQPRFITCRIRQPT